MTYRNASAARLLERGHHVFELDGRIACRNDTTDLEFTIALRDLALTPITKMREEAAPLERRSVKIRDAKGKPVIGTLIALRPESTLGSFGRTAQALFTLFEPGSPVEIDPFILSATFDLTPAEARLASLVVNGRSPQECADELGVKISTVRSQLLAIYAKTGVDGQTGLVRLLLSATAV
jgi:DNA-binding CsgD family transcriptional regulator